MAFSGKAAMITFLMMALFAIISSATDYKVGDDSGWHPGFDYSAWASSKKFYVGDTITFVYKAGNHDVKEVTHDDFRACNGSNPKATKESGNDTFTLQRPGHRYFLCDFPNHCSNGQKVDIRILQQYNDAQSPSPSSGPTLAPAPSPANNGPSSLHSKVPIVVVASLAVVLLF